MASDPQGLTRCVGAGVVLVTGASRGIGRATALGFHRRGWPVALVARDERALRAVADEIAADGGHAVVCAGDVAATGFAEFCFEEAERELGPVTVSVNSAGVFAAFGPIWEVPPERWLDIQRVNVGGVFLFTRAALQRMVPRGSGVVLNISSGAARKVTVGRSAYSTSKAAVDQLSRIAAAEALEFGVNVFSIYPGLVDTDMQRDLREAPTHLTGAEARQSPIEHQRQGRLIPPGEVADALVRLALDPALAGGDVVVRLDTLAAVQ